MPPLLLALASEHTDAPTAVQEAQPGFRFIPQKGPNRLAIPFKLRPVSFGRLNRLAFAPKTVRLEVDHLPSYGDPVDQVNNPDVRPSTRERPHVADFVVPLKRAFDLLK